MTNCSASRRHGAGLDRAVGPDARRKGADTFPPVGPWLVTADEIPDPQDLDLFLDLNGTRRQTGKTRTMIFDVAWLDRHISRRPTLLPGGIVTTGTPSGVGLRRKTGRAACRERVCQYV